MCCFWPQRGAHVSESFFLNLSNAPQRGVAAFISVVNMRKLRPVKEAGVGDCAAERIAVAADVLGQRVNNERCADRFRLKQVWRGHCIVDAVNQAPVCAKLANAREICDLGCRVGDGLDEHQFGVALQRAFDVVSTRRIDEAHLDAHIL